MRITHNRKLKTLKLSEEDYIKKVVDRFQMTNVKPMSTPLRGQFKSLKSESLKIEAESEYMLCVPTRLLLVA